MWCDTLLEQRRTVHSSRRDMFVHQVLDGVGAEPSACEAWEKELASNRPRFGHPSLQDLPSGFGDGSAALLPTFPDALNVRTGAKGNIVTAKPGKLREAQAGLQGNKQQGVISPADPASAVDSSKQRFDLRSRQE